MMHTSYRIRGVSFSSLDELHDLVRELEKLASLPFPPNIERSSTRLNLDVTQRRIEIVPWAGTWQYRVGYYTQAAGETTSLLGFYDYTRQQLQQL